LTRLHLRVSADVTHPMRRGRVDEILYLASRADMTGGGYALPDLRPIRNDWERIRADVFAPADWFQSGGADVDAAQRRPVPTVTDQQVYELTRVIERLEELIADGRDDCDDLGEPQYNLEAPGLAGRAQIARWNIWAREWSDDIDHVAGFLPRPPPWDGEQNFAMAYQEIDRAVGDLRLVPHGAGAWPTPFRYNWEQRFTSATHFLNDARNHLYNTAR
jgi:hypothetical protein